MGVELRPEGHEGPIISSSSPIFSTAFYFSLSALPCVCSCFCLWPFSFSLVSFFSYFSFFCVPPGLLWLSACFLIHRCKRRSVSMLCRAHFIPFSCCFPLSSARRSSLLVLFLFSSIGNDERFRSILLFFDTCIASVQLLDARRKRILTSDSPCQFPLTPESLR